MTQFQPLSANGLTTHGNISQGLLRDQLGHAPIHVPEAGPVTSVQLQIPVTQLKPLSAMGQEYSCLPRSQLGAMPACAFGGRPVDLGPIVGLETVL